MVSSFFEGAPTKFLYECCRANISLSPSFVVYCSRCSFLDLFKGINIPLEVWVPDRGAVFDLGDDRGKCTYIDIWSLGAYTCLTRSLLVSYIQLFKLWVPLAREGFY